MKKNFKYGLTSTALLIGIFAVIVLVNVFVSVLVDKFPIKIDLTSTQLYEISENTYKYLENYDKPTTIYILASETEEDKRVKNILEKYSQSNKNIKLVNINTAEDLTFGSKYTEPGTSLYSNSVIIECGERFKVLSPYDLYGTSQTQADGVLLTSLNVEQKVTAGLKFVSSNSNFTVCFISGHGEAEMLGARQTLEESNFEIVNVNLSTEEIPEEANMVVVAAPTNDYTMAEIAKLDKFFHNAGKGQFIFDPTVTGLDNLYNYIKDWGIQVNDDVAVEESMGSQIRIGNTAMFLVRPEFEENELTAPIEESQRLMAYYPYSKSLTMLFEANNGIEVKKLLSTTDDTYTTEDLTSLEKTDSSRSGKQVVAAVATRQGDTPDTDSIIFVSGTSLLLDIDRETISNNYGFANSEFYTNVVSYLQGSEDDYTISPKSLAVDRLNITERDAILIGIIFVIVVPVLILVYGIVIWVKRRNL